MSNMLGAYVIMTFFYYILIGTPLGVIIPKLDKRNENNKTQSKRAYTIKSTLLLIVAISFFITPIIMAVILGLQNQTH